MGSWSCTREVAPLTAPVDVPPHLIAAFGSSHVPVDWQVSEFLDQETNPIKDSLEELMLSIDDETLRAHMSAQEFRLPHGRAHEALRAREARKEIISRVIDQRVNQERMRLLRATCPHDRVPPYNHPALLDLPMSEDNLVDLKLFHSSKGLLERNGYVFELAPTLPAVNSSYWLMQNLRAQHEGISKSVRLDPLAIQSRDSYRAILYKMWVYGVPLDWTRIASLIQDLHGRWMPDDLIDTGVAFTDVVWSPRGKEVHFICEEVPARDRIHERGSRYLHAIYLPEQGHFIHVDGAIRYYSNDEEESRLNSHVRNAGKAGQRVKIFRSEGLIPTDVWGGSVASFFVWNTDVMNYVTGRGELSAV